MTAPSKKTAPIIQDATSRFQRDVHKMVRDNTTNTLTQGQLITKVTLGTATTRVPHTLGRPFVGWKVVDQSADARVWRDTTDNSSPGTTLPLLASAAVTVSLWVF